MTTAIMLILSALSGCLIGFTLGITSSASRAIPFGKWKIYMFEAYNDSNMYNIVCENTLGDRLSTTLNKNAGFTNNVKFAK